ncbi:MAG: LacI family DNA-binding transcriptional regulator [Anaerolineaceae bacterium]
MNKRATAKDVADAAGVSRTTVSFVLNNTEGMRISEDTRRKVLQAAETLNYHPDASARSMVKGKTLILGLVIRQEPDKAYADLLLPEVMRGISEVAGEHAYHLIFKPVPPEDEKNSLSTLFLEHQVDGLIVSGPLSNDQEIVDLFNANAPIILQGRIDYPNIPSVDINNRKAAEKAVNHLISLGHQRIAFISNASLKYSSSKDRLTGYRRALEAAGLAYDEALVFYGDRTPDSGYQAMQNILQSSIKPSAIFIASDTVALGSLNALYQKNIRVPEDIAIMGFDDIPLSKHLAPPLSTIHIPAYQLGWNAANLLINWLDHKEIPEQDCILDTELIVRESCGSRHK